MLTALNQWFYICPCYGLWFSVPTLPPKALLSALQLRYALKIVVLLRRKRSHCAAQTAFASQDPGSVHKVPLIPPHRPKVCPNFKNFKSNN